MALTMLTTSTPALASSLSYTYAAPSGGHFGKPTSTEPVTVVDGEPVNINISKDSAFVPPAFGSPPADVLGTGELLTPDIAGIEPMFPHSRQAQFAPGVTETGTVTGSGEIVLPPDAAGSEVSSAPVYAVPSAASGGYTGAGADAAIGAGYTPVNGMAYADGSIGTLVIPAIGVSRRVYEGESIGNMRLGAAHFEGTSAWDGNVAMCGHNRGSYGYFSRIHELKNGDTITYTTAYGTRSYQVYSVRKIANTETDVLRPTTENIITLITCVRDVPSQRWCVQAIAV